MPMYEFVCPGGHVVDELRAIDRRDELLLCPECGLDMSREFTIPTIHTVSTHLPGKSDGGGYYDFNIRDRATGNPTYIHSLGQKQRLLRERGLVECGDDMSLPGAAKRRDDERSERRKAVTVSSQRSIR